MSKITKALEKAARERLQRQRAQPTVTVQPKATEVATTTPTSPVAPAMGGRLADPVRLDPHLVMASDPQSAIAEQYRMLRINLLSRRRAGQAKVLLITSAVHGEGKSVTSINLALSLAEQENRRILLIDADLRRGSIHKWLGLQGERGLSTALTGGGSVEELIVQLPGSRLSVLPAGLVIQRPIELLESAGMKRLIGELRGQFDFIVVDAPPILAVADAGILERLTDGTVLVVRSGSTQKKTVLQAQAHLQKLHGKLVGCILTHAEFYIPGYSKYYKRYRESAGKNGKDAYTAATAPPDGAAHRDASASSPAPATAREVSSPHKDPSSLLKKGHLLRCALRSLVRRIRNIRLRGRLRTPRICHLFEQTASTRVFQHPARS